MKGKLFETEVVSFTDADFQFSDEMYFLNRFRPSLWTNFMNDLSLFTLFVLFIHFCAILHFLDEWFNGMLCHKCICYFFYLTDSIYIFYEPIIECSLTALLICLHSFMIVAILYFLDEKMNGILSHSIVPSSDEMFCFDKMSSRWHEELWEWVWLKSLLSFLSLFLELDAAVDLSSPALWWTVIHLIVQCPAWGLLWFRVLCPCSYHVTFLLWCHCLPMPWDS
jgi:hypothetical protein